MSEQRGASSTRLGAHHKGGCPFRLLKAHASYTFAEKWPRARLELAERLVERPEILNYACIVLCVLRLKSGNLYVGSTTDIEKRYEDHCGYLGRACGTTKFDSPVAIALLEQLKTFSQARLREAQVKRWSRAKKEALVAGDLLTLRNLSKSK